ncbi:MAG: hypothetical protein IH987_21420 [Planctomycetes bacterium]|nr:hypothetical protein [Planctomycetota bacterium]
MKHFDRPYRYAGRQSYPAQLAALLLTRRWAKDPAPKVDHAWEMLDLCLEDLEETCPLLTNLTQVQRRILSRLRRVAERQIEDVLG